MKNNILLLTHGSVGQAMLKAASNTLGYLPDEVIALAVDTQPNAEQISQHISQLLAQQKSLQLLVLTDLYGSTPCNVVSKLAKENADRIAVVSGLNFGMLIKSINYLSLPLEELKNKAVDGGKACIKTCGND